MYKVPKFEKTSLEINDSVEGETIEQRLERVVHNGDEVDDGAPSIYTERKDGVLAGYDIRSDKWDIALDAIGVAHKSDLNKRQQGIKDREEKEKGEERTEIVNELHNKESQKGGETE